MLANIRTAVHNFAIETPLWVEELCHAEHDGAEGVEVIAGSLSNIVINARKHICLAITEDFDGFIQDLDNFQGPGRIESGSEEERKRKRETSTDKDSQESRRPRSSTEIPPDSTGYDPGQHPGPIARRAQTQQRIEAEQRRSIEESMHPKDIADLKGQWAQDQWIQEQHPIIGVRWSEHA